MDGMQHQTLQPVSKGHQDHGLEGVRQPHGGHSPDARHQAQIAKVQSKTVRKHSSVRRHQSNLHQPAGAGHSKGQISQYAMPIRIEGGGSGGCSSSQDRDIEDAKEGVNRQQNYNGTAPPNQRLATEQK